MLSSLPCFPTFVLFCYILHFQCFCFGTGVPRHSAGVLAHPYVCMWYVSFAMCMHH